MNDKVVVVIGCIGTVLPVALVGLFAYYAGIGWVMAWLIAWKLIAVLTTLCVAWAIQNKPMTLYRAQLLTYSNEVVTVLIGNTPLIVLIWAIIHEGGLTAFWEACYWTWMR